VERGSGKVSLELVPLSTKNNMRIWHKDLIPVLCRQHLLAVWREALGCYSIITNDKKGYRNHPAVKEFEEDVGRLEWVLLKVRREMLMRGYNPKPLPFEHLCQPNKYPKEWQTLEQQIEVLKSKKCNCKI